jgi:hypothetical protein
MAGAIAVWLAALAVFGAIYAGLRRRSGGTAPAPWPFIVAIVALAALALVVGVLS